MRVSRSKIEIFELGFKNKWPEHLKPKFSTISYIILYDIVGNFGFKCLGHLFLKPDSQKSIFDLFTLL